MSLSTLYSEHSHGGRAGPHPHRVGLSVQHYCIMVFGQLIKIHILVYMDKSDQVFNIINARLCPQTGQSHLFDKMAGGEWPNDIPGKAGKTWLKRSHVIL